MRSDFIKLSLVTLLGSVSLSLISKDIDYRLSQTTPIISRSACEAMIAANCLRIVYFLVRELFDFYFIDNCTLTVDSSIASIAYIHHNSIHSPGFGLTSYEVYLRIPFWVNHHPRSATLIYPDWSFFNVGWLLRDHPRRLHLRTILDHHPWNRRSGTCFNWEGILTRIKLYRELIPFPGKFYLRRTYFDSCVGLNSPPRGLAEHHI